MDQQITYEDAYDQSLDEQMMELVKDGILNPRPVLDTLNFRSIWGFDDLEVPAYARRVAQKIA